MTGMTACKPACPECLKALQNWCHGGFRAECIPCQIRNVAGSPKHIREGAYDQMLKLRGPAALAEFKECVRLEHARIQQLKGAINGLRDS